MLSDYQDCVTDTQTGGNMKLYSLSILYKGATKSNLLKAAYDLSSFSFFQRSRCVSLTKRNSFYCSSLFLRVLTCASHITGSIYFTISKCFLLYTKYCFGLFSIQEFMTFTSALIVERTSQGTRASVKEQGKQI